jgi:hypothetical protein
VGDSEREDRAAAYMGLEADIVDEVRELGELTREVERQPPPE